MAKKMAKQWLNTQRMGFCGFPFWDDCGMTINSQGIPQDSPNGHLFFGTMTKHEIFGVPILETNRLKEFLGVLFPGSLG